MNAGQGETKNVWVRVLAGLMGLLALAFAARITYVVIHELRPDYAFMAIGVGLLLFTLLMIWFFLPICLLGRCCWPLYRWLEGVGKKSIGTMRIGEAQTKKAWVRVLAGLLVLVAFALDAPTICAVIHDYELRQSYVFWAVVAGNQVLTLLYIWLALPVCLLGRFCWPFNRQKRTGPSERQ